MKVYVIQVVPEASIGKVSQEGYSSLEKAQAFVESRADKPKKLDDYTYKTDNYTYYTICEVNIV